MRNLLAALTAFALGLGLSSCSPPGDAPEAASGNVTNTTALASPETTRPAKSQPATTPSPTTTATSAPARVPLPGLNDNTDTELATDPVITTGTLDNGLTYYVKPNDNPGRKVTMYLVVKAGSVDELGATSGVAHYLEHMLFNGTEKFPKNELVNTLRSFGAAFGADVNAYTSFNETVYSLNMSHDDQTVELGLNVLEQWLSHATISDDEVESERGVILDEWRSRTQTRRGRLFDIAQEMFLSNTAFEGRSPIGAEQAIEQITGEELRAYYDAWYRPDNAAVIVVGDINSIVTAADIKRVFGPAVARTEQPPQRPDTAFAPYSAPAFSLHADPEQTTVDVEVTLPIPRIDSIGEAAVRADILDRLMFSVLISRLDQDIASGTAEFDEIMSGSNSFTRHLDAPALYARTDSQRVDKTLRALLDEYHRAVHFGITEKELARAIQELRAPYDSKYEGRNSYQDSAYADDFKRAFLRSASAPSLEDSYAQLTAVIDSVTTDDVHQRFLARWTNSAPHVIISTPETDADTVPDEAAVRQAIDDAASTPVDKREPLRDLPDQLMERPDPSAPIEQVRLVPNRWEGFDPIEYTFNNGVRLIVSSNTIVENQFYVSAIGTGGTALVADEDVADAFVAAEVVTSSGVGEYNQAELAEIISGADLKIDAELTPHTEEWTASAATTDAEVLFQLINQYMTNPRVDQVALDRVMKRNERVVADISVDAWAARVRARTEARYPGESRFRRLPTPEEFATIDLEGIERVWKDRYSNPSDFVFVIAGDIDPDTAASLAGSYLATIPAGTPEPIQNIEPAPPETVIDLDITAGTGNTATLDIQMTTPVSAVTSGLRVNTSLAQEIVDARITDQLREAQGETYSPHVSFRITGDPGPEVVLSITITGAPDRMDVIADAVMKELSDLAKNGPSEGEYTNAKAQVEEQYRFVHNGEYLDLLTRSATYPEYSPQLFYDDNTAVLDLRRRRTHHFLRDYLPLDRYIQVVTTPAS